MDPVFLAIMLIAVFAVLVAIFANSSSSEEDQEQRIVIIEENPILIGEDGQPIEDEYEEWPEEGCLEEDRVEEDDTVDFPPPSESIEEMAEEIINEPVEDPGEWQK